jgi:hypothetical protein
MRFFENIKEYYKDNPEGLWFKKKLYGWGWTPVRWQGWATVLLFVLFIFWNELIIFGGGITTKSDFTYLTLRIIFAITLLIFICYKKGEKPGWQWGLPKK